MNKDAEKFIRNWQDEDSDEIFESMMGYIGDIRYWTEIPSKAGEIFVFVFDGEPVEYGSVIHNMFSAVAAAASDGVFNAIRDVFEIDLHILESAISSKYELHSDDYEGPGIKELEDRIKVAEGVSKWLEKNKERLIRMKEQIGSGAKTD